MRRDLATRRGQDNEVLRAADTPFPRSAFFEVKAVDGAITLSLNRSQALGLVDVAARSPAGTSSDPDRPPPILTFITTGNTVIGGDVIREATQRGVAIFQQLVWEDGTSNNPLLALGFPVLLNPAVAANGLVIPPASFSVPSTLTSPTTPPTEIPGDDDPAEVQ